jgi:hypothetical protein
MFTIDQTVDTIQGAKKQFVKTFVTNEAVAGALNSFVDAQADYTKKAAKVGMDTFTTLASEATKSAQNAMKFDYVKFGEGVMKAYTNLSK